YDERWEEMLAGPIEVTVAVLAALRDRGVPLYALTNWSAEKLPIARRRFDFLTWFDDIAVSGEIGPKQPDPQIFRHLFDRHGRVPAQTLFIDDSDPNVTAAAQRDMPALRFRSPEGLCWDLAARGLLRDEEIAPWMWFPPGAGRRLFVAFPGLPS